MKKLFILALVICPLLAFAQLPKYGSVKPEDFSLRPLAPEDSAANVYILYHDNDTWFTYSSQNYQTYRETQIRQRFLVLKEDGKDYANVSIAYRYDTNASRSDNDIVNNVSATAYNLVDGKVVKTNMSSKYIFTEQASEHYKTIKFAVPDVKVGTIVEFKYYIKSPAFYNVPTWYAQRPYPVKMAHLNIQYPDFFTFNNFSKGFTPLKIKKDNANVNFFESADAMSVPGFKIDCSANDIIALRKEPFLENSDIYASRVEFELLGIQVPGSVYKSYARTWEDVRKGLKESDHFGRYLNIKNVFEEQIAEIDMSAMNSIEKARSVFSILKKNMKWDESFALYVKKNPKSKIDDGVGSNADLNFLLLSMLKQVGVNCTPMLVKKRKFGPILTPTIDDFSTFIVAFSDDEGNLYFLDSSSDYGDVNSILLSLLGYGVLYDPTIVPDALPIYNLFEISGNVNKIDIQGLITEEGEVQAQRRSNNYGLKALLFKQDYHDKDSVEYVENLEKRMDIHLASFSLKNADGIGSQCRETIRFSKSFDAADGRLYINPIVVPDEHENLFTSETRVCPVEIPFTQSTTITSRLALPEGYEVEELPEAKTIAMSDGSIEASIGMTVVQNMLVTQYVCNYNTTLISQDVYAELRKFWNDLLEINNMTIVLKKK